MITFFRNISETWIVKGLLLLVGVSMVGLFGLGSMTSMWGKEQTAIRVGNSTVKGADLVRDMDKEIRRVSQMTGNRTYLSMTDAIKMGLLNKVVQNNVNSLVAQSIADDMGLIASDAAVGNYIVNNPNFQTITGTFDRSMMVAYLQQMQMSEQQFIQALQEELSRKHLTDAIDAVVAVPALLKDKMYAYTNETRDLDVILLPSKSVPVTGKPDAETLQAYYDSMQDQLYAPEYRTLSVLKLTPDKVAADIKVDDDVLKAMYDERKEMYSKPERRRIDQILVDSQEKANALIAELTADNFVAVAKEKAAQDNVDLGWVEKRGVVEEIGEAAFNAPVGKVLPPVQTMFGFHILVVREIEAAEQTPFEKVKEDLIKTVQGEKAYELLYEKSKQLDEALGEGLSLSQAAERIGIEPDTAVTIDAAGVDKKGNPSGLPVQLVQDAFMSQAGEATALQDFQNGFIVAQVEQIEPVYLKPIEEVQVELNAEWLKDEQKKLAPEFAQKVFNAAKKDKVLKTVALFYHVDEKELKDVKRIDIADMPTDVITQLFNAKVGDVQLIEMGNGDYAVARVDKINVADKEDTVAQMNLEIGLRQQMQASILEELFAYYADKEKVQVNQAVIDEVFLPYMKNQE